MKKIFGIDNLKFVYSCIRAATTPFNFQFYYSTYMNEIFKNVVQLKNLVKNIQRKSDKTSSRKERI